MKKSVFFSNGNLAWEIRRYPNIISETGCLGVLEFGNEIDFSVKRMFFLRNIDKDAVRGLHAHEELKQVILCLKGSFKLTLDNGQVREEISMVADDRCVFVDGKVWREMESFSEDAVMLVLCDREYRFDKVIRDYKVFEKNLKSIGDGI